ncbi:MAG: ATP synthase subunit I [Deltaproteobacteria bacterium]|nr:ATP synthase subunit I [Deltaproteobacteria bacterium]
MHAATASEQLPPPVTEGLPHGARRIAFLAALLIVPAMCAGFSVGGLGAAASVVVGGFIAVVNFWLLSRLVVATTASEDLSAAKLLFQLMSKLAVLGILIAVSVFALGLDPLGLLLGLGVIFAAVPLNLFSEWMAAR